MWYRFQLHYNVYLWLRLTKGSPHNVGPSFSICSFPFCGGIYLFQFQLLIVLKLNLVCPKHTSKGRKMGN